jgi:TolA-binding protein
MTEDEATPFKERVTRQGEETLGKLAQDLLENPVVNRAIAAAFETRERASRAQELAMGALNLPSASDLERLTRRLRSVSQRLEAIEDSIDRLQDRIDSLASANGTGRQLAAIEDRLSKIEARLSDGSPPPGPAARGKRGAAATAPARQAKPSPGTSPDRAA